MEGEVIEAGEQLDPDLAAFRPNDLARQFAEGEREIDREVGNAVLRAHRQGEILLELKRRIPHGEFEQWCDRHLPVKDRQRQKYMQLAKAHSRAGLANQASINAALGYVRVKDGNGGGGQEGAGSASPVPAVEYIQVVDPETGDVELIRATRSEGETTIARFYNAGAAVVVKGEELRPSELHADICQDALARRRL